MKIKIKTQISFKKYCLWWRRDPLFRNSFKWFFFPTEYAKSGGFSHLNLLRECKYLCVWLEELQGEKKEKCHGDITQKHHFTDAFV